MAVNTGGQMKSAFINEEYLLWRLSFQVIHLFRKARQKELAPYGISPRKAAILLLSKFLDGQVTPYKIAQWLILEPQTVSEVVSRMEKEGLIKKIQNHDARKSVRIELTDKGHELCNEAMKLKSVHKIISSLSQEQQQQLAKILKTLRSVAMKEIGLNYKMPFSPL